MKTFLILISIVIAVATIFAFTAWMNAVIQSTTYTPAHITCVSDTVIQPDGSCLPQEVN